MNFAMQRINFVSDWAVWFNWDWWIDLGL